MIVVAGGVAEDYSVVAKATIRPPPGSVSAPGGGRNSPRSATTKTCSYPQCLSYPLEYLAPKTKFASLPVQFQYRRTLMWNTTNIHYSHPSATGGHRRTTSLNYKSYHNKNLLYAAFTFTIFHSALTSVLKILHMIFNVV